MRQKWPIILLQRAKTSKNFLVKVSDFIKMNVLTFDIEDWFHILDHPEVENPASWDSSQAELSKVQI